MTDTDVVEKIWVFVIRDSRFSKLGLRGGIREICRAATGSVPGDDVVTRIVRSFWLAWDESYAKPNEARIGGGSRYYAREGELSPWQENAIRALEDSRDV